MFVKVAWASIEFICIVLVFNFNILCFIFVSFSISINGTVFADEVLTVNGQNLTVNGGTDFLFLYRKAIGINMFSQSFTNVKLVSQEFNSSADDILSVKLSYKGYLNN